MPWLLLYFWSIRKFICDFTLLASLYCKGNLYVIELEVEKANPYLVKAYLESANGLNALSWVAVEPVIPDISVERLKRVMIPLPPMEVQNELAEKYMVKMDEVKVLRYRLSKATDELKIFTRRAEYVIDKRGAFRMERQNFKQ
mgnify:CR=1 FL=1